MAFSTGGPMMQKHDSSDSFELERFVQAQERVFDSALAEIRNGRKHSHWMWHVFPQMAGLGHSEMARRYGIRGAAEARAFTKHPVLGPRLIECFESLLKVKGRSAREIFGTPDDLKLWSCATLFAQVAPPGSVFTHVLDQYFDAVRDSKTLELLEAAEK